MSVQVKHRREAASYLDASFVGVQGELVVDTTNNRVRVCDGSAIGGHPAARLSEVPVAPSAHGATARLSWVEQSIDLSGTDVSFTLGMPSYSAILLALACRVTTTVVGCADFRIGTTAGGAEFANGIGTAVGSTSNGVGNPIGYYGGNLHITPSGGAANFSAGQVRISALVLTVLPPAT